MSLDASDLDVSLAAAEASPRDATRLIKAAAIKRLEALDPSTRIHNTQYFNHSFAPDLVLRWPKSRDVERYVYLRLSDRADEIAEDVSLVAQQHPIVLGLRKAQPAAEATERRWVADELGSKARESDTLVSDLSAIDALAETGGSDAFAGLLNSSVAQGGRGVLDAEDAIQVSGAIAAGFKGAQSMRADDVAVAKQVADGLLSEAYSGRVTRFMQAVWIGAGGRRDLFPGPVDLSGGLDDDALQFLLGLPLVADNDFWRRLGRTLTVPQLSRLDVSNPSENLQAIIAANLDVLQARVCHIVDEQESLLEEHGELDWYWSVDRGALALRALTFAAYVAEKSDDFRKLDGTPTGGITVDELRVRAVDTTISSVQLSDGREEIDLANRAGEDVKQSERLSTVAGAWGASARIRRARAVVPSGTNMNLDFSTSSASAVTRSLFSLPELLGTAIPLLRRLDARQMDALEDLLADESAPGSDLSLFD